MFRAEKEREVERVKFQLAKPFPNCAIAEPAEPQEADKQRFALIDRSVGRKLPLACAWGREPFVDLQRRCDRLVLGAQQELGGVLAPGGAREILQGPNHSKKREEEISTASLKSGNELSAELRGSINKSY